MPPVVRRPAAPVAAPVAAGPNFLDLSFYSGGFLLPPGRYAMEHNVVLHAFTDKNGNQRGDAKLGVMLTAYPLDGGDPIQQFESMGTKAHLSFMPNETGKGVIPVPGGPGTLTNKANWFYYLESMYNTGLPQGVVTNDLSVIDGVWVVTDNILEPEDRKGFASTGEIEQANTGPKKMPVVVEIIDGGKPWEGGGGFPEAGKAVAAPAAAPKAAATRPAARPAAAAAPPAPAAAASVDGDAIYTAAVNGIASVLTKAQNAKGMVKLMLKTGTFKAVTDAESNAVAQQVIDAYFGADESALTGILNELGFTVNGTRVEPAA
jgi:hypothetical protein